MTIWVDADACPRPIKDIICRAAIRTQTECLFVANQSISLPNSPLLKSIQVMAGYDVADNEIVNRSNAGDLVITQDIPLAAELVEKAVFVLTPRGEWLNSNNVRQRLMMRDFNETLRASGMHSGGPSPLNQKDRMAFGNQLDSWLARHKPKK
ncbi:MAG: YaiI/YqxD family protein [Gammaproteobacteria bacterium]|nr:YaiI/YqxD family protein [Gammaproteobacteria bacterium]